MPENNICLNKKIIEMKNSISLLLLVFTCSISLAQSNLQKIVVNDSIGIMTIDLADMLEGYLLPAGVQYEDYLDYSSRCEYYIVNLKRRGNDFEVSAVDCERKVLGTKTLFSEIKMANPEALAKALATEIVAILKLDSNIASKLKGDGTEKVVINHHVSRHFFAPTAYNLEKGELYYSTLYGLVHEVQYGVSDNVSIGMGTTIGLIPVYVTPKFSFDLGEGLQLAFGDLLILGTWGTDFYANLGFGALTIGSKTNNVTLGGGVLTATGLSGAQGVMNLSTMQSFSRYVYLISENYLAPNSNDPLFGGFTGLRFVRKDKDVGSFQFGMAYLAFDSNFFPFPAVSYTHKFGKKL